jgi:hypothetical protein
MPSSLVAVFGFTCTKLPYVLKVVPRLVAKSISSYQPKHVLIAGSLDYIQRKLELSPGKYHHIKNPVSKVYTYRAWNIDDLL